MGKAPLKPDVFDDVSLTSHSSCTELVAQQQVLLVARY
jgi:hypothetical protein